jgi:glycosyltransferase involved in cell wall biosynthesis
MLTKVPPFEVIKAASASHVGVILTRPISISYELTVSNKLFECINAGLPVILSDVPEHRYLNEKYKFGIILEEISSECLAEAAIKLKNDFKLYETLKQNAIVASKELCWENEGMKLVSVYRDITNKEDKENEADTIKKGHYINV